VLSAFFFIVLSPHLSPHLSPRHYFLEYFATLTMLFKGYLNGIKKAANLRLVNTEKA